MCYQAFHISTQLHLASVRLEEQTKKVDAKQN
jgi:hypothetical protein